MKSFQLAAQLEGYRSLKDRTLKLSFETSELTPEKMADIHYSLNKVGWLAFAPDPFTTKEMNDLDALKVDFDAGKTPGQRLRGVLYRLWEQRPEGHKVFNDYYNSKMEVLIDHFKKQLDT
jgi:hypothetical protein